jgi:hypothetical protein
MDKIVELAPILEREVATYAAPSPDAKLYDVSNPTSRAYAVILVPDDDPQASSIVIFARITNNMIIIDTDNTDRPLYETLIQAGVPQNQIVLAYEGANAPMA